MMMVPYMFNEALMDDLFSNDWEHDFDRAMKAAAPRGMFGKRAANVMKTDVRENKDNGYLTISAQRNEELDDKDNEGHYIRQERATGSCARSFYVGKELEPKDISAKFENGILTLHLPKAEAKKLESKQTLIEIE